MNLPGKDFCEHIGLLLRSPSVLAPDQQKPQFTFTAEFRPEPDGSFEISDVPPGNYQLSISANPQGLAIPQEFHIPVNCESKAGQISEGVQLALPDAITGRGKVVDAQSGEPIAGATVMFLRQEQIRSYIGVTTTDAKGEYRAYLRPGKIVVEPGKAPDEYLAPVDDLASPAIEYTKDFEVPTFKYPRAITFRGTVVDAQGRPVPGADVQSFQPGRKGKGFPKPITSDESGRFEIPQIDPRDAMPIRVRALKACRLRLCPANELVEPKPIVVSENAFRLKGTLTNQRGRPVANVTVAVHWHRRYVSKDSNVGTAAKSKGEDQRIGTI